MDNQQAGKRINMRTISRDDEGTMRFDVNPIVRFLLDAGPFDMNQLAMMGWSDEAYAEFAELIGYSISGYAELSYVTDERYNLAQLEAELKREVRA